MSIQLKDLDNFEIIIDGKTHLVKVREICEVNETNLKEEFVKYPGQLAWWSTVKALFAAKRDSLEEQKGILEAELDSGVRAKLDAVEKKTIKEKEITSRVMLDPRFKLLREECMEARAVCRRLDALIKGLEAKQNMLIQIGSRIRKEMELDKFQM